MLSDYKRPAVLLVDDEPFNLSLLEGVLGDDYAITKACNGEEACRLALAQPPDLILLDLIMPDMDGFEVCRRLKHHLATADVPVIFITARDDVHDEELGFAAGAADFIHKPVSLRIVVARVRAYLCIKFMQDYLRWTEIEAGCDGRAPSSELQFLQNFIRGTG